MNNDDDDDDEINEEPWPTVKTFSSDEEKLKAVGELFSNDTGRKIIFTILYEEMYIQQIADKLQLRVNHVTYHLKKMTELGILKIIFKKLKKRKGNKHRHFKMIPIITFILNKTDEEIKDTGILKKIFREGVKFVAIGFLSIITWKYFATLHIPEINDNYNLVESTSENLTIPIIIFSIIGLLIYLYLKKRKKGL